MRARRIHPKDLGPAERSAWADLRAAHAELASPYFSPGFAQTIGQARSDARLVLIEDGARLVGVLPIQGRSRTTAQPLGSPLADYQGLIAAPEFAAGGAWMCGAAGIARFDFTAVPANQATFAPWAQGGTHSWVAETGMGKEPYLALLKARRSETVRGQDRKRRKLEREEAGVVLTCADPDGAHLETLLDWKAAHCARSGQPLVWAKPWVREAVRASFSSTDPDFGGVLCTLKARRGLIAGAYLLRSGPVLHGWVLAHDPSFDVYSPGVLLVRGLLEWAADQGFREVDFGPGDYRFKKEFHTTVRPIIFGYVSKPSLAGAVRGLAYAGRRLIEQSPYPPLAGAPGKLMRRLDLLRDLGAPP